MKELKKLIKTVPDFPMVGVLFRDITPLLEHREAFHSLRKVMYFKMSPQDPDKIVAVEARGFLLGAALATAACTGLVIVRKPRKLPRKRISESYSLEYNQKESLEIHADAIRKGESVVIVDDVLATGGTALAAAKLVERLGGKVKQLLFLIEIKNLKGREKLKGYNVESIIKF